MSFQDLGKAARNVITPQLARTTLASPPGNSSSAEPDGRSAGASEHSEPDPVVAGVFQMNTAVSTFKRLVNSLGTPKDTPELREKLLRSRQYITQLAKDTSAKLKETSSRDHGVDISTSKRLSDAKLAKDFEGVLREFEKAQHMAAEREAAYSPRESSAHRAWGQQQQVHQSAQGSRGHADISTHPAEEHPLLARQQRQEMLRLEGEVAYTEAVIEERDAGIREVQAQIGEVTEIFRDLAVLVREQGVMIDDIEANIETTHVQAVQANKQLGKAARSQRESNSFTCWVMAVFAVALFILFLVMSS